MSKEGWPPQWRTRAQACRRTLRTPLCSAGEWFRAAGPGWADHPAVALGRRRHVRIHRFWAGCGVWMTDG